ncbi:histidinol-phosphate aminotransferase family protein [Nonomuraea roseoviolacea]|uniref:Aminotransferase n=1 Tax=Nonomuraea roseoviolacea subsp. carminata TaxID=160689 RepID=A0ABT1K9N9_9ACTN|nr:histidinol-phosphate transaminase [Nonomuraea roseoviolacea]MCP2349684.1 histidinol-phosphate/aromatic aminotransferase/cobyric acid decarboxylase-like protein/GNAT superfamily N-acetyltransferase [Nonomuraea roseoviolacea subsp. carminata]
MTVAADRLELRPATDADREWIYRLRHDVYARELGQHTPNAAGRLTDDLDENNAYIVAAHQDGPVGFVSVTPPWAGRYSIDKYLRRQDHPELRRSDLFEIRILTVDPSRRGAMTGKLLMYAALRWVMAHGGRVVVALGRVELLPMYLSLGLVSTGVPVRSGAVDFELLTGEVADLADRTLRRYGPLLDELGQTVRWALDMPFLPEADSCQHGGASVEALGRRFDTLEAHRDVVPADVLDAWFPPAPAVVAALSGGQEWMARTSPPARAAGLVEEIAFRRNVPEQAVAVGAGSSDLIFRAFGHWLDASSRVLLVDPSYGEYAHVVERVIGCRADRFSLRRAEGWRIDPDRLADRLRERYDLVVVVNPNNPTGVHLDADELREVLARAPGGTRFWIDEAYAGYSGPGQSLERYAADTDTTVVCRSMSKMYALSGLRVAYLTGPPRVAAELRRRTPPWAVSLPAQIAAVHALRDPGYYSGRWAQTAALRAELAAALAGAGADLEAEESVANFVLLTLPRGGPGAARLVGLCRRQGVFLRDLSPLSPAFEGRTVRIAVRDAAANARTAEAVAEALRDLARTV